MKGKYIDTQILLACLSKPVVKAEKVFFNEQQLTPDELKKITAHASALRTFIHEAA